MTQSPNGDVDWDEAMPGIVALMKFAQAMDQARAVSDVWRFALRGNDEAATRRIRDLDDETLAHVADVSRTLSVLTTAALKSRENKT